MDLYPSWRKRAQADILSGIANRHSSFNTFSALGRSKHGRVDAIRACENWGI